MKGETLSHAAIWFASDNVSGGAAYVAISRVQYMKDLLFLRKPEQWHFMPV